MAQAVHTCVCHERYLSCIICCCDCGHVWVVACMGELAFVLQGQRLGGRRHCGRLLSARSGIVLCGTGAQSERLATSALQRLFFREGFPLAFPQFQRARAGTPGSPKFWRDFPPQLVFSGGMPKKQIGLAPFATTSVCLPHSWSVVTFMQCRGHLMP